LVVAHYILLYHLLTHAINVLTALWGEGGLQSDTELQPNQPNHCHSFKSDTLLCCALLRCAACAVQHRAQAADKGIPFIDLKHLSLLELQLYLLPVFRYDRVLGCSCTHLG
jgi:hypothetical protein